MRAFFFAAALVIAGCINSDFANDAGVPKQLDFSIPVFDLLGVDLYSAYDCKALNACENACTTAVCVFNCRKMATPTAVVEEIALQDCFGQYCPTSSAAAAPSARRTTWAPTPTPVTRASTTATSRRASPARVRRPSATSAWCRRPPAATTHDRSLSSLARPPRPHPRGQVGLQPELVVAGRRRHLPLVRHGDDRAVDADRLALLALAAPAARRPTPPELDQP